MLEWFKAKIKSVNSVVDVGVIITLVISLLTILIYLYKITYLHIIGIPVSISLNIVDVKFTDYIVSIILVYPIILFGMFSYYTLYIYTPLIRFRNFVIVVLFTVILGSISVRMKICTIDEIVVILAVFIISYILSLIVFRFLFNRPKDIIGKIFRSDKEINKLIVFVSETVLIFGAIIIITLYLANIRVIIPTNVTLVGEQLVIYSSQDALLVSDYKISTEATGTIKRISIDYCTLKITSKEKSYTVLDDKFILNNKHDIKLE